jgi:hypothetical protein
MRLHYGSIPEDPNFDPQAEGWQGIREPSPNALQLFAIPVALLVFILLIVILLAISPDVRAWQSGGIRFTIGIPEDMGKVASTSYMFGMYALGLAGMLLIILLHEVIHALLMPCFGLTPRTLIAVWPQKLLFYAHHIDRMPRNQFLLVFLGPLIVLTGLPLVLISLLAQFPGTLTAQLWLAAIALFNGVSACGDIIGFGLILFQIPARAFVRNQGWKSYWKLAEA